MFQFTTRRRSKNDSYHGARQNIGGFFFLLLLPSGFGSHTRNVSPLRWREQFRSGFPALLPASSALDVIRVPLAFADSVFDLATRNIED